MIRTDIFVTDRFLVTSHGHGVAYEFTNHDTETSVFIQGDDAVTFEEELQAFEAARPSEATDRTLERLWAIYEELAEPAELLLAA